MRHLTRSITLAFIIIGLFTVGPALAVPQPHRQPDAAQTAGEALKIRQNRIVENEPAKIMPVLDDRIKDPEILTKTREKLLTLPVKDIRLVSSLCDRVAASEKTPRADIVFSLVTALIVLS